jgi:hypothetical protein
MGDESIVKVIATISPTISLIVTSLLVKHIKSIGSSHNGVIKLLE